MGLGFHDDAKYLARTALRKQEEGSDPVAFIESFMDNYDTESPASPPTAKKE